MTAKALPSIMMVVDTKGIYTDLFVGDDKEAPIPSTIKFGNNNETHFMTLESKSGCLLPARNRVDLTCIPAQNIANLVGK